MKKYKEGTDGLSQETEAVLYKQAQAGCKSSLNQLMSRHERLVIFVVRRQGLGQLSFEAALHEGRKGLWRAILGYDAQRGYAFSTYAYPAIARQVWRAVKQKEKADKHSATKPTIREMDDKDPAKMWEEWEVHTALHALVTQLPERLQKVIMARYGLGGKPKATYREIGEQLGLTKERARQLHTEALVWMRHPPNSQQLRSMLGRHTLADYEAAAAQAQRWLRRRRGGGSG